MSGSTPPWKRPASSEEQARTGSAPEQEGTAPLPRLLTLAEAAKVLRIGRTSAYERVRSGELPALRIGRAIRIPEPALRDWIDRKVTFHSGPPESWPVGSRGWDW